MALGRAGPSKGYQGGGPVVGPEEKIPRAVYGKQSKEEQADVEMVLRLYGQGKAARADHDKDWHEYLNFYDGKQWKDTAPMYKSRPNINICRSTVQTLLPIMTDAEPGFNIGPKEPSDVGFAAMMQEVVSHWWTSRVVANKIIDVIMDILRLGTGFIKVLWNPDLADGLGDVYVVTVNPQDIYGPRYSEDVNEKCPWIIQRMQKTIGELKRKFPDKREVLDRVGRGDTAPSPDQKQATMAGDINLVSPTDRKSHLTHIPEVQGSIADNRTVEVLEVYMDDEGVEEYEYEYEDENGKKETRKGLRKKYPHGRLLIVLPDEQILLHAADNPTPGGLKPFVRFVNYQLPREFWAEGDIKPLMDIQRLINRVVGSMVDHLRMFGNPVWIIDSDSGVNPGRLTNQVGLIIRKKAGSAVQRESPPPMPAYPFQLYEKFMELSEQFSGVHDVTQGRRPTGVTAAEAINTLQEAAQTRVRLKERRMQTSLTQLGYLVVATMMQRYRDWRVVKIVGKERYPRFRGFSFDETEDENGVRGISYIQKEYRYNDESGEYDEGMPVEGHSKGIFDIEVSGGTSVPFQKWKREELAFRLYDKGVIDGEELLDAVDWPNKEEAKRKLQEREAMAAEGAPVDGAPAGPPAMQIAQ